MESVETVELIDIIIFRIRHTVQRGVWLSILLISVFWTRAHTEKSKVVPLQNSLRDRLKEMSKVGPFKISVFFSFPGLLSVCDQLFMAYNCARDCSLSLGR